MKKIIFILLVLIGFDLQAQENLTFGKQKEIVSPQINADNSVTFRLDAPNAKVVKIQGDFISPEANGPGTISLNKDASGIWTCTTSVHQ